MLPVPANSTTAVAASLSPSSPPDFFLKDGRRIHVGDCALFKPPQDSPPFIGIIQKLVTGGKEETLCLGVNWLYRPSDVKLAKGASLEVAPNEVFYSFHKDEIPAVSLLHLCKVAFLRKGVELPSGISSFVCKRVYDIDKKRLWWLTDKNYIKERQEEINKLLDKTQLEMHWVVPSGGHSPQTLNSPVSATQLKPSSDSVQNTTSSSARVKGKKRERVDQGSDPIKRERLSKPEEGESCQSRAEHVLKSEIAKITNRGGLVDLEGVKKLLQLMQPDVADKKLDLAGRIMLVDVIAVTDQFECLGLFVQFRGLNVLDEWLQEVQKGEIGDGCSPVESEKSVMDFLSALLRALDKLPVDLHALQNCHIGKSINHLRNHENYEIQKKSKRLIDTWKKRVELELNKDANYGSNRAVSWPTKPAPTEVSHVGNRKSGLSVEGRLRSSTTQVSALKSAQVKLEDGVGTSKSASATASVGGNSKDPNFQMPVGVGSPDQCLTPIKEERSSSFSQSQNNSQSCSIEHAKTIVSLCREDATGSTAGSVMASKSPNGASRQRKSSRVVHGPAVSGGHRDAGSAKVISSTVVQNDKLPDMPIADNGNSQRLIVRLPNTVCSPSRGDNGGSVENPAVMSNKAASSAEKCDNHERRVKARTETVQSNVFSSMNPDLCQGKNGLGVSDEGMVSAVCDDGQKPNVDGQKVVELAKATASPLTAMPRLRKSYEASFTSINALVESCAKLSEARVSASPEDDVGMNLLASVATREILKSENVSPSASPLRNSPATEESCSGNDDKLIHTGEEISQNLFQSDDGICADSKLNSDALKPRSDEKPDELLCNASAVPSSSHLKNETCAEVEGVNRSHEPRKLGAQKGVGISISDSNKSKVKSHVLEDHKKIEHAVENTLESIIAVVSELATPSAKVEKEANEKSVRSALEIGSHNQNDVDRNTGNGFLIESKLSPMAEVYQYPLDSKSDNVSPSGKDNMLHMKTKAEISNDKKTGVDSEQNGKPTKGCGSVTDHNNECAKHNSERVDAPVRSVSHMQLQLVSAQENQSHERSSRPKFNALQSEGMEGQEASVGNALVSAARPGKIVKLDFDLNEGIALDDGNEEDHLRVAGPGILTSVHLPCPLPVPFSSMSGSFSTSITVAAPAKGSFVFPGNSLLTKGELGWKGSAATSAFRPAEPRRIWEMPVSSTGEIPNADTTATTQVRRPLDFDLNEPGEGILEDDVGASCYESGSYSRVTGRLNLDLNSVDEVPDSGVFSTSNKPRSETLGVPSRPSLLSGLSNNSPNASRDFDLNNGPAPDEVGTDTALCIHPIKSSSQFPSFIPGVRMSSAEFVNCSSWFPPRSSYSSITVPSVLPNRREQNFVAAAGTPRIMVPNSSTSFVSEMYQGPVLSSSPVVPFPYPGFPFETNLPLSSNTFSGASTAYVGSLFGERIRFPSIPS